MRIYHFFIIILSCGFLAACSASKSKSVTIEPLSSADIAAVKDFNKSLEDQSNLNKN